MADAEREENESVKNKEEEEMEGVAAEEEEEDSSENEDDEAERQIAELEQQVKHVSQVLFVNSLISLTSFRGPTQHVVDVDSIVRCRVFMLLKAAC